MNFKTRKTVDNALTQSFFNHAVGTMSIDINPMASHLHQFPGPGEFAFRVAVLRKQYPHPGIGALLHTAGIRCMRGNDRAVKQFYISQKTLVAPEQSPLDKGMR